MTTFRNDLFSSLILLPIANACGHLAPAIGSSWAAVGMPLLDYPVIVLLFSVHTLLDSGHLEFFPMIRATLILH